MRIIVISDTHGRPSLIEKIIEAQPDAKDIFFLGDLIKDIELLPDIKTSDRVDANSSLGICFPSTQRLIT